MAASSITVLTDETFEEEIKASELPILVDFWAEWCGPCRLVAPVLDDLASEHADKIRIGKLNVDHAQQTARRYDVLSIPTLIVFKDGVAKKRLVGARGKGQLVADLQEFLA